ncbi:sulfatase-like hydrolase/transferase [Rubripirellula sp.]|nr:sulfatase-like hydrolase/transferase [Rubripirellula sp.]
MKNIAFFLSLIAFVVGVVETSLASQSASIQDRPNVLFIAIDDLRPELGCYGAAHIHSPNIDALAASGRRFDRAYCQQAVCNPSRTSVMTGMRPDSTGVLGNHSHFREANPDLITLPQHFKQHGYHAAAIGKIYHGVFPDGASKTKWDTMGDPESWSEPAIRFGPRYYYTEEGVAAAQAAFQRMYQPTNTASDDWTRKLVFGLATESPNVADETLYDGKVAKAAVEALRRFKESDQPFFLSVGFIKPHSPQIAPQKYFDLYQSVDLPTNPVFPVEAPSFAGHGSGELRRYTDQPNRGPIPESNQRRVRQAYYACISYIDAQVGRVLNELRETGLSENTIVILWGDHGYHLGEHRLWGKTTNFELDTRVPLIVKVPAMAEPGKSSSALVELVDLYPTLAELAGLPIAESLDGDSLVSILKHPTQSIKSVAFSQYPRGGGLMGYSMRTSTHRLTQWIDRSSKQIRATELYDYGEGWLEKENIAAKAPRLVEKLTAQLTTELALEIAEPANTAAVGFERGKAGVFDELRTELGVWKPQIGRTIIDDKHAKTGKHCLQLTGGDQTSVILELANPLEAPCELSFWAERWTSRKPFSFRIESYNGDDWTEIYNGDAAVRVGRAFLNHVTIPLRDTSIQQLRFTVTSPANTGVLIDDLRIAPLQPQKIVSVETVPFSLPALVGTAASPLLKLKVTTAGQLNPISLKQVAVAFADASESIDLESIYLYSADASGRPRALPLPAVPVEQAGRGNQTGKAESRLGDVMTYSLASPIQLVEGENLIWVAARLQQQADVGGSIGAQLNRVSFSNGQSVDVDGGRSAQRIGVAVRQGGDDGVHTYRIPGLATTNEGTLIGVYDVRYRSGGDLPGDIDVGMSRSTDGGKTWQPMQIIMDQGDDPKWRYDGIGDPAVLVDRNTGTIWVAATWSHGNRSWVGSGPGIQPEQTGQLMLVRSDDDGVTWSDPINITEQIKKPEWCFILQGPGKGITMRDGTLVFAAQYQDPPNQKRLPHSTIIYSKDHGKTWQVGAGAFDDTTESQVVEIEPGVLMLNCRYNRKSVRVVMTTRDLGKTWQRHPTSERSLIEPRSCMASLIDVNRELGEQTEGWLLFSNPDSTQGRRRIMIKASPDRGLTWPSKHRLLLDEGSSAGYSCMTMIDQDTVGILFEGSQSQMTFMRVQLSEILGNEKFDRPKDPDPVSQLRLPRLFGDHMVLQADAELPVWGQAKAGATVSVTFGDETVATTANSTGHWSLRMRPRPASAKPQPMFVQSEGQQIQIQDIVIGEVWVCAGQSNMAWMLRQSTHGKEAISAADQPDLRLLDWSRAARGGPLVFTSEQLERLTPQTFGEGGWQKASADSAPEFSAVAYYFGRLLQQQLQVPVGLICPAVGGTPTETWISRQTLANDPALRGLVAGNWLDNSELSDFCRTRGEQNLLAAMQAGDLVPGDSFGPNHAFKPGFMWSAGIEPIIPFAIRGVIWYQGESNAETADRARQHAQLFPLLIESWRTAWKQGDFPFLFVQLPGMNRPAWPLFRETQRRVLDQLEQVGMAITIDTGVSGNVHPPLKKPVGERLARLALASTYRLNSIEESPIPAASGPLVQSTRRTDNGITVSFQQQGDGLRSVDGKPLRHFEICGSDGIFHSATANIIGRDEVFVTNSLVHDPVGVRYAWQPFPNPPVNLGDSTGMPASPFTTEEEPSVQGLGRSRSTNAKPNILFIVSEDNSDHLGCYGEERVHTPHLDGLATAGVRYTRAYVPYSVCSPSRAAFLTGFYTRQTGHIGLATHRFAMHRDFKTMPAYFQEAGYYTGFIGKTHINPANLVEDYVDHRAIRDANFGKTTSIKTVASEARAVMQKAVDSNQPFLLIVNYADAHRRFVRKSKHGFPSVLVDQEISPYSWIGSDSPHLREELRDYLNCINRLDEGIGMILDDVDEMKIRDNTLVVYISDHGADFPRGKGSIYENGTRIPMIVSYPKGFPQGKVESAMVSTTDILPTMLQAAGLPIPKELPGFALQQIDRGQVPVRKYIHTFTTGSSPNLLYLQFGIRDDRYKLVYNPDRALNRLAVSRYKNSQLPSEQHQQCFLYPPEYELFDLQDDPDEWKNLDGDPQHAATKQRLLTAMRHFQKQINDPFADPKNLWAFIDEQKEYQQKPYKIPGFRWPHLVLFGESSESEPTSLQP